MKALDNASETAVKLKQPNKMTMKDSKDLKRRLKDGSHTLRQWVDEFDKVTDEILNVITQKEEKMQQLESRNKNLEEIIETLTMEINKFKISLSEDAKANKAKSIMFKAEEIHPDTETVIACQFRESILKNSAAREFQKSDKWSLKEQPYFSSAQMNPVLHEDDEIQTLEELDINSSEQPEFFRCPWDLSKLLHCSYHLSRRLSCPWDPSMILLAILLSFGLCIALILLYTCFFNNNFIANSLLLLFDDHNVAELTQLFSPCLSWKNNGLLPF